jgi:copper(I)-binding protein
MGVLLFSPVALSACSAGQVAQTADQNRDKVGGQANVGDLAIREARLAYPVSGEYQEGGDARLVVAIANGGATDDTLVSVTSDAFDSAEVTGTTAPTTAAGASGTGGLDVPIPANTNVFISGTGPVITVSGLSEAFAPGQSLDITMTFEKAGKVSVQALVGTSTRDLPRGEAFDFDQSEGSGG